MVLSSRVLQPPVSGVPVAGATSNTTLAQSYFAAKLIELTGRVEGVNVKGQVNWVLGTDTVDDALNDALSTNRINLTRLDNLKATVAVVVVVAGTGESGADTGVDVGVVGEQTLHRGVVEVSTCDSQFPFIEEFLSPMDLP